MLLRKNRSVLVLVHNDAHKLVADTSVTLPPILPSLTDLEEGPPSPPQNSCPVLSQEDSLLTVPRGLLFTSLPQCSCSRTAFLIHPISNGNLPTLRLFPRIFLLLVLVTNIPDVRYIHILIMFCIPFQNEMVTMCSETPLQESCTQFYSRCIHLCTIYITQYFTFASLIGKV